MEHRASRQMASTLYNRQFAPLLPESPFHLVPEIERSGLEWFDIWLYEMIHEDGNGDQNVPVSPFSDTAEKMLNSQETDFTVPSTPNDHRLQDVVSAIDQTLVWNPLAQVPQVRLDPQATATDESCH